MATFKLTIKRGQKAPDIARAGGSAIAGSDAIELNVDVTTMTKGEFDVLMDELERYVLEHGWPS